MRSKLHCNILFSVCSDRQTYHGFLGDLKCSAGLICITSNIVLLYYDHHCLFNSLYTRDTHCYIYWSLHSLVAKQTHQSVSLPPAVTGHRHGYGSREVFSRWSTAGSAAHCELRAGQAEVQYVSSCSGLDGRGWTACCMHLKLMSTEEDSVIRIKMVLDTVRSPTISD